MERELIDPQFPFTVDEVAAAWILHGISLEEAQMLALSIAKCVRAGADEEDSDDWSFARGYGFVGGFEATLNLAADIHCGGALLDAAARAAWLSKWTPHTDDSEIEATLDRLAGLGPSWATQRVQFRQLLCTKQAKSRGTDPTPE